MTPEDLLARQAQFWRAVGARAFEWRDRPEVTAAFRPGAPLYAMDRYFCQLVDEARLTIPPDEVFRPETLLTPTGWIFLEEPAPLPQIPERHDVPSRLQTVGWAARDDGVHCVALTVKPGFGLGFPWAFWACRPTQTLGQQMALLEQGSPHPYASPNEPRHECRWFYTAVNLMANKLTLVAREPFARAVRRRAASRGVVLPDAFRRVTLRRVEAARLQAGPAGQKPDYQCQWVVRGHWRHYRTGKVVFIASFIKGPVGKPLKPLRTPFFQVNR